MIKVLHVISDENIGGAGILLTTLLETMDRNRVESAVALPAKSLLRRRVESLGIKVIPLRYSCDRVSVRSVEEIKKTAECLDVDIIHANAAICARIAGRLCRRIVVHTRHCCFSTPQIYRISLIRRMSGWINGRLSDRIIATADAAAKNLYAMGVKESSIEVIVNGSKPIRQVSEVELQAVREKWNVDRDSFCVGICARLEEYKGQDVFLRAIKLISDQKNASNIDFFIVGDGSMRETLERMAIEMGIASRVRFTGFVADMAPIYRLLDLNVNCSRGTETSCLALSEGMSASLPFLATDFGGNVAMLGKSEAGFLFPIDDAETLASLILRIATDQMLFLRMRNAARARYETKYTATRMSEHLVAVYEDLIRIRDAGRSLQR